LVALRLSERASGLDPQVRQEVAEILLQGIAAAPPDFVDSALARMETLDNGLFWEVNERVVAFDWVDPDLRVQIPALREALSRNTRRHDRGRAPSQDAGDPDDLVPLTKKL